MLDLAAEIDSVREALNERGIPYAVCGGIAMAIHGFTRATEDIDLLIRPEDYERVRALVHPLGFKFEARPMNFSGGAMQIRRVTKIDTDGDVLMLDLLLVTSESEDVWQRRETIMWRQRPFSVVDRSGLIKLKRMRGSDQDLIDIRRLEEE